MRFINLKRRKKKSLAQNEKGMAMLEAIPVLFTLVLIFNFSLGFFGAIHSGILNSIASYNYAVETFRFKSNLMYFRPGGGTTNYSKSLNRVHGTTQDGSEVQVGKEDKGKWPVTLRGITFNFIKDDAKRGLASQGAESNRDWADKNSSTNIWHADSKYIPDGSNAIQTPRIWVKTIYGICLNAVCEM